MEEQDIILYVGEDGIIPNLIEDIVEKKVVITIKITPEIKEIINKQKIQIKICDNFLNKKQMTHLEFFVDDNIKINE
jgi:hypothetical protein